MVRHSSKNWYNEMREKLIFSRKRRVFLWKKENLRI